MRVSIALAPLVTLVACSRPQPGPDSSVHTLRLPEENVVMPEGPGRGMLLTACVVCHTPRYVLDQPGLSRKAWQAEIDKMRSAYGAPISDADAPAILEYLVAVRGSGT